MTTLIKYCRESRRLTQKFVANQIKIHYSKLSMIENRRMIAGREEQARLCKFYEEWQSSNGKIVPERMFENSGLARL